MILQPVELTKIHYYDARKEIATISREVFDNRLNANVVVEKNLFRHRWVLKINEIGGGRDRVRWRLVVCILVLSCLVVAVVFGVYFSLFRRTRVEVVYSFGENQSSATVLPTSQLTHEKITASFCQNCTRDSICMKLSETAVPTCVDARDRKDPTGCGGFCSVNTQFCQLLDNHHRIYQCSNLKNTLKCPSDAFNCGNMCIKMDRRCDGVIHCSNKSDELDCDCDLDTHFRCSNVTSCLPKSKKCDGIVDCWDKTDEIDCKTALGCKNGTIPCLNGDCIPHSHFCDGKYHCLDRSDEPQGCQL